MLGNFGKFDHQPQSGPSEFRRHTRVSAINKFLPGLLGVLLALSAAGTQAQTLGKAADLKASPAPEAKTVKSLPANAPAKLLKRQGFWVEIESGGASGWVKLSDLNMGSGGTSISAMDTGRTGKGNIVSTSAARGLSAKELTAAKPDVQQFEQLRALSVSAADAEAFAQAGGLKVRTVALLAAPPAASSSGGTAGSGSTAPARRKPAKSADDDDDE